MFTAVTDGFFLNFGYFISANISNFAGNLIFHQNEHDSVSKHEKEPPMQAAVRRYMNMTEAEI